jgi:hypothetical protein
MLNQTRRGYTRTSSWEVSAKISADKHKWTEAEVLDIAAGGLLFLADSSHNVGEQFYFDLEINPKLLEVHGAVKIKVKGQIKSDRGVQKKKNAYSVEFTEISRSDQIRLDELVRLSTAKFRLHDVDD